MMAYVEYVPPPLPRPTLSYANCYVSEPVGYRPLHLDLHVPPGDGPFPVVLWIHGGGWMSGSRVMLPASVAPYGFHERLVGRGYAVADVDYRLAMEALGVSASDCVFVDDVLQYVEGARRLGIEAFQHTSTDDT